jgi:hypothetical protein
VYETLTWSVEDLTWNGGTLALAWGTERLRVPIEVDPGITLTVPEEEAARYTGEWRIEDAANRPPMEQIEAVLADPETDDIYRRYMEAMRDVPTDRVVRILRDPESGWLFRTDPGFAAVWASIMGIGEGDPRLEILVPREEGFFVFAQGVGGELMGYSPEYMPIGEFIYDEAGRAVRFELRDPEDKLIMTGERVEG